MRGVVAVIPSDRKLLVIRRSQLVRAPGMHCFPGGSIEAGESEGQALVRELEEELGAEVVPGRRLWESTTPWQVELVWWLATLANQTPLRPDASEVASFEWLEPQRVRELPDLLESNHHFLAAWDRGEFRLDL